jgi:hypothetical protein
MRAQSSAERSLDGFLKEEVIVLTIELVLELVLNIGHKIPDPPTPSGGGRERHSGDHADPSAYGGHHVPPASGAVG